MSSYRYYVVGDCDMWAIQYAPAELAQCISRSKVIAFAIGAAQKFGRRGEHAHVCVLDRAGCLRSKLRSTEIGRGQSPDDFLMRSLDPRACVHPNRLKRVRVSVSSYAKPRFPVQNKRILRK